MAVRYIQSRLSFKQVTLSAQSARLVVGATYLRRFTELMVRMSVWSTVAISLQNLQTFLSRSRCWAYIIAFDTETNRGDDYMDFRVHILVNSKLYK